MVRNIWDNRFGIPERVSSPGFMVPPARTAALASMGTWGD